MIRILLAASLFLLSSPLQAQVEDSKEYFTRHAVDLRQTSYYIKQQVVGFTAMHGSKKAEDAELALLKAQLEMVDTLVYIPEVDPTMGYYFNLYLQNGDEQLLKDLILTYASYVPQEASVEMFSKWKELRRLSEKKHIVVYGLDRINSYRFTVSYLMELMKDKPDVYNRLSEFWNSNQTDYSTGKETPLKQYLQSLQPTYTILKSEECTPIQAYLLEKITASFSTKQPVRDSIMYRNYLLVKSSFDTHKQFIRMGLFHMTKLPFVKMQQGFIARLIQNGTYKKSEVYVSMALLHRSKVLLDRKYDESGAYSGYNDTGDGFYTGETIFPGVSLLATYRLSDMTLFELTDNESPFKQVKGVIYTGFELLPNTSWTDYFDSAVLIDSSEANEPIERML